MVHYLFKFSKWLKVTPLTDPTFRIYDWQRGYICNPYFFLKKLFKVEESILTGAIGIPQ